MRRGVKWSLVLIAAMAAAMALLLLTAGCGLFTPNINKEAARTNEAAINKDQAQPAGTDARAKDASTVNIYQGDKAIKAATARQTTAVSTAGKPRLLTHPPAHNFCRGFPYDSFLGYDQVGEAWPG